jgi:hypothetical protein
VGSGTEGAAVVVETVGFRADDYDVGDEAQGGKSFVHGLRGYIPCIVLSAVVSDCIARIYPSTRAVVVTRNVDTWSQRTRGVARAGGKRDRLATAEGDAVVVVAASRPGCGPHANEDDADTGRRGAEGRTRSSGPAAETALPVVPWCRKHVWKPRVEVLYPYSAVLYGTPAHHAEAESTRGPVLGAGHVVGACDGGHGPHAARRHGAAAADGAVGSQPRAAAAPAAPLPRRACRAVLRRSPRRRGAPPPPARCHGPGRSGRVREGASDAEVRAIEGQYRPPT